MKKVILIVVSICLLNLSLMAQWQIPKGDINAQDNDGNTALIRASINNDIKTVKLLLEAGADPNIQTTEGGSTALMIASQYYTGHTGIVKLLIENGADVNIKNNQNETALMKAYNTEIVASLIKAGAHLNIKENNGFTALMYASQEGYTDIERALINAGAHLNIKENQGATALMYASKFGHTEIVRLLEAAGAK